MISNTALLWIVFAAVLASSQSPPSTVKRKTLTKNTLRSDSKCLFLNEEYRRIRNDSEEFARTARFSDSITLTDLAGLSATIDELGESIAAAEELIARVSILRLKSNSCEMGEALSSLERLPAIDAARQKHLRRVKANWQKRGGEEGAAQLRVITDRINSIYDTEARSFYNSDSIRSDLNAEVIKDYPQLLQAIRESSLPNEQKIFLEQNGRYIRYEEAGRLFNILKGIDPNGSIGYAYTLRRSLEARVQQAGLAAEAEAARHTAQSALERAYMMTWVWVAGSLIAAALVGTLIFVNSKRYAKYKAIRSGQLRVPYSWGTKELILWEPGEAVVLLRNKKLVAMVDATGGYTSISAWKGEEYKGRITYKTQMMKYTSDTIQTSDGVAVNLELGIFWQIGNPNDYVQRIAADYHEDGIHQGSPRNYTDDPRGEKYYDRKLTETAEKWIRLLAGSSLREHLCRLSAAKLISPSVQAYIQEYYGSAPQLSENAQHLMPTTLESAQEALSAKLVRYGIRIEKLEVNELKLPRTLQDKLETVRLSFLQPAQAAAETEAKKIDKRGLNEAQLEALRGLAGIIGKNNVAKIEFLKAIGLAKIPFATPSAPPFAVLQSIFSSQEIPEPSLAELQAELQGEAKPFEEVRNPEVHQPHDPTKH
jgi:regulator of protease activity HflC (stomatin/prohibitin superfamily)